jgi:hypothetical protein
MTTGAAEGGAAAAPLTASPTATAVPMNLNDFLADMGIPLSVAAIAPNWMERKD